MPNIEGAKTGAVEVSEQKQRRPAFEFKDVASAEEYLDWKRAVPAHFRRLIERDIAQADGLPRTGLQLTDRFLAEAARLLGRKEKEGAGELPKPVQNLVEPLLKVKTEGGFINVFDILRNPDVSWALKRRVYDTQIRAALEWFANRDLAELARAAKEKSGAGPDKVPAGPSEEPGKKEKTGSPGDSNDVPPQNEDVRSSMEAGTEKGEGEPNALFRVAPFYGGYYRQLVFGIFDSGTLKWGKTQNEFRDVASEAYNPVEARVMLGKIRGSVPLALPLPYDWTFDSESVKTDAPEGSMEIQRNQDGLWYLRVNADGIFTYEIRAGSRGRISENAEFPKMSIQGEIDAELKNKIEALKRQNLPSLKLKREIVKLVRNHLTYSNSADAWAAYAKNPAEFFTVLWKCKEADCFVANTMALRALAEIDGNARFVSGYFVKERNAAGQAIMHSGNGHAWLEVWDSLSRRAIRLDATPKGDSTMDEETQERDLDGESGEGDYGEGGDDELASEEEVKRQIKEMQKKGGGAGGKKKERSAADLEAEQFAQAAECTPEEAREFLRALERVREIKDERGNSISELMKDEWRKIIEERKIEARDYRGPVRMDEGSRLEDPVSARIDIRSKEFNPTGFERDEMVEKVESDFGGINIYFSFDLSGSMGKPDSATGRRKADVQRDAALLFVDSLMQCAYMVRREVHETDLLPLKLMVTLASSRGEVRLHLTDKWTAKEQWALYSALIQLASGSTPTHQTMQLIEVDFDKEMNDLKKKRVPKEKLPINYTAEITDGGPDNFEATEEMHRKLKSKRMTVRSFVIGGNSVSEDAAPPLRSFSQLPQILARDIIEQFRKLHPQKIKV
ncbi:MAG: hypothetical protein A2939_05635 [Parcubacteria group bacterium RIFCSPLOWO2_01_FULL_48_18]|nr:MAG: hypothetical protein A2939_05635 [Parcubacteria group bacterium RIFCSPLOWO2_01_FULL_48_18]